MLSENAGEIALNSMLNYLSTFLIKGILYNTILFLQPILFIHNSLPCASSSERPLLVMLYLTSSCYCSLGFPFFPLALRTPLQHHLQNSELSQPLQMTKPSQSSLKNTTFHIHCFHKLLIPNLLLLNFFTAFPHKINFC